MTATCPACGHSVRVDWTRHFRGEPAIDCSRCRATLGTHPLAVLAAVALAIGISFLVFDAIPRQWTLLGPPLVFWSSALSAALLLVGFDAFGLSVRRRAPMPAWSRPVNLAVLGVFALWLVVALALTLARGGP